MGEENLAEFAAAEAGDSEWRSSCAASGRASSRRAARRSGPRSGSCSRPSISHAATGEFAEYLAALFHGGLEEDIWGWFDDDRAFFTGWGFALAGDRSARSRSGRVRRTGWSPTRTAVARRERRGRARRLLHGRGPPVDPVGSYGRLLDDLVEAAGLPGQTA